MTREEILKKWKKASSTQKSKWVSEFVFNQPVRSVDWNGHFITSKATGIEHRMPDYASDISAAWEVEEKIKEIGGLMIGYYMTELLLIVGNRGFDMVHATPDQRCKAALLAVLGEVEA